MATRNQTEREGPSTTDVGHGRKRRGRRAGGKRHIPRAAIAAGALAAASIPLWPSAASATTYDEYKSERHTITTSPTCTVTVTSFRNGTHVEATTTLDYDASPGCGGAVATNLSYVPRGSNSVKTIRGYGKVTADDARDLTHSDHGLCWTFDPFFTACTEPITLNHPK